jgi:hypothetical protein
MSRSSTAFVWRARHPDRTARRKRGDMAWVLLTGAGLVAETVVIVVLGRRATTRSETVPPSGPSSTLPVPFGGDPAHPSG